MSTYNLNIGEFINPKSFALAGRPDGEKLLADLKKKGIILIEIEKKFEKIEIIIPTRIVLLNKSFFLGWMETRVQELGKEGFLSKYKFEARKFIKDKIQNDFVDAALLTLKPEEILKFDKR